MYQGGRTTKGDFGVAKMPSCAQFDSKERRLLPSGASIWSVNRAVNQSIALYSASLPTTREGPRRLALVTVAQVVATLVSAVKNLGIGARFVEVPQIRTGSVIANSR